ncbi:MAG: malto-oligosyltrehalose trehalohydrolase [Actinobacteria bacterium]|nr:malto-oligosyltrehalose trehalohydrolase [Actinomycetota bacterium]
MSPALTWERPLGARPNGDGTTTFRVWAPQAGGVALRLGGADHPMDDAGLGVREATVRAGHGDDYRYVLDGTAWPDPCTRWQPEGIRGPSRVVDPARFVWTDDRWHGVRLGDLVVYELHIGAFTAEGTFDAAATRLPALADLGVTAVEVMPVGEFPGARGWGYDVVYPWAAQSSYGGPEGFARFVDAAHAAGLAVLLDVVYNHVGASGTPAYRAFGPYFTGKYSTFWGDAPNFDDRGSGAVREWVLQGAEGWLRDFHVDGLRVDAMHAIYDQGPEHLGAALARRAHGARPGAVLVSESGMNDPKVTRPREVGGWGFDADWADDFHHALRTVLTGDRGGWYADFGSVAQLAKAFERPYVHDGAWSSFRGRRHGAPAPDRRPEQFVVFAQNHDQVGNRAVGDRPPAETRPLAAFCVLLSPFTPMLFMGEEHGEVAPFVFFTDHIDESIAQATTEGRKREFSAFGAFSSDDVPDPQARATFERSKLTGTGEPAGIGDLYRRLLAVRREVRSATTGTEWSEDDRWLVVHRGPHRLACSFARREQLVPCRPGEIVVATHDAQVVEGGVRLPPLAGALLR